MSKYDSIGYAPNVDNIRNIIVDGENILWEGKPKKSAFVINKSLTMMPFALVWLLFDGTFIAGIAASGAVSEAFWFIIPFFAIHLMPVWIWLGNVFSASKRWRNTRYVVTDKRIIIQSGFIGIDYQTIYYKDIKNVYLKVGAIDKLLKVGDVYFDTEFSAKQAFLDIENPYEIYPKLQKAVLDIQTDIEYPNDLRPDRNSGYNTNYTMKI